jgi:gas vesicle protein
MKKHEFYARPYEDESRLGNTAKATMIGAGIGGIVGGAFNAATGPATSRNALSNLAEAKKMGATIGKVVPKGMPGARNTLAWSLKQHRKIAKGGFAGRGRAAMIGAASTGLLGAGVGGLVGVLRRPRSSEELAAKNLSADLKPALRELAARSEAITEFAMVRDANGQFVEVEDEGGMGMGTAVKAGAGAAALGGAGYGAYRADRAIMGKYGKQGLIENMDSRNLPSAYAGTTAAGTGTATRGQAYRSALKDISNSATSRVRQGWAAGNAAYNAAGRRASAALPVEGSGFGAKLLRGIRKGLSVATKMA